MAIKYGYFRPSTQSELTAGKEKLKVDELAFDLVNPVRRGSNAALGVVVDKMVNGDELVILSLTDAFADRHILHHTLTTLTDKGCKLRSLEDSFSTHATDAESMKNSLNAVFDFQNYKEQQDHTSVAFGAKRIEYPNNFLQVFDSYRSGSIPTLRDAAAECFVALNTFRKLVQEWDN
jgi:hypothetical protein